VLFRSREWLARNNFSSRRFGADFAFDGFHRRGFHGGFNRFHDGFLGFHRGFHGPRHFSVFGAHVNRHFWRDWCGPIRRHSWGGWCSSYFLPTCYPRWYSPAYCGTYFGPTWSLGISAWSYGGYGWSNAGWGLWDYPGGYASYEPEYEIENYYAAPQPVYTSDYANAYAGAVTSLPLTQTYATQSYAQSPIPPTSSVLPQEAASVPPELADYGQPDEGIAADSYRTIAIQAFARGDFETARREFIRAVVAEPEDAELLMMYGYAHFATGDYLVAALSIRRAIEDDPSLLGGPVDIMALYNHDLTAFDRHVARLDEHLQADYEDAEGRFLAGFVRYAAGRTAESMGFFADCVARNPNDVMSLQLRDAAMQASRQSTSATSPEQAVPAAPAAIEYLDMVPVTPS
jgi:tetratricopeptide (TPR) repeat protein